MQKKLEKNKNKSKNESGDHEFNDNNSDDDDDEFAYDPIEGCTEEQVGWMMIAGPAIDAKLLGEEMCDELWYVYYKRPDDILYCC